MGQRFTPRQRVTAIHRQINGDGLCGGGLPRFHIEAQLLELLLEALLAGVHLAGHTLKHTR